MRADLLAAIKPREEPVTLGPHKLVVRELAIAADVVALQDNVDMTYKLAVRCVLDAATGEPIWTDEDIPALKAGAKFAMLPVMEAVQRVNGLSIEDNEKKSEASPG